MSNEFGDTVDRVSPTGVVTRGVVSGFNAPLDMRYDADGRLQRDENAVGGWKELARTRDGEATTVTIATAMGRTTGYLTEKLGDGTVRLTMTQPDGTVSVSEQRRDGSGELGVQAVGHGDLTERARAGADGDGLQQPDHDDRGDDDAGCRAQEPFEPQPRRGETEPRRRPLIGRQVDDEGVAADGAPQGRAQGQPDEDHEQD